MIVADTNLIAYLYLPGKFCAAAEEVLLLRLGVVGTETVAQ